MADKTDLKVVFVGDWEVRDLSNIQDRLTKFKFPIAIEYFLENNHKYFDTFDIVFILYESYCRQVYESHEKMIVVFQTIEAQTLFLRRKRITHPKTISMESSELTNYGHFYQLCEDAQAKKHQKFVDSQKKTKLNQKQIIVEKISERIRENLMKAVEAMPDDFDGFEIAQYLQDYVSTDIAYKEKEFKKQNQRYKRYKNWYLTFLSHPVN